MTVRKTQREDHEVIGANGKVSLINYLTGPIGFRVTILILVLSMHPVGRQLLGTFGFEFPDSRKLNVATDEASKAKNEVSAIASDVKELKTDMATIKVNNLNLTSKVDALDQSFHGFQIDFAKYQQTKKDN